MICDDCKHNRTSVENIRVDGKTVAQYIECGCTKEDELTEERQNIVYDEGDCPFYEYDTNLDDSCYGCPGSPDYCDTCDKKE